MTDDQIAGVLQRIEVIWTQGPLSRAGAREWQFALRTFTITDANTALDGLVARGLPRPNLAQFVSELKALHPNTPPAVEHQTWDGPTEFGRAHLKRAKEILAAAKPWSRHDQGEPA